MTRTQAKQHAAHAGRTSALSIPGLGRSTRSLDGPCPYCGAEATVERSAQRD